MGINRLNQERWPNLFFGWVPLGTFREYRAEAVASAGQPSNPDEIRFIQGALNQILKARLTVDGAWGKATQAALTEFQRKFNLTPDGILGPKTMVELKRQFILSHLRVSQSSP